MEMEYEDLVQLAQSGKITLVQFVTMQEDLKEEFQDYCERHGKNPESNKSAKEFLEWYDDYVMDHQF